MIRAGFWFTALRLSALLLFGGIFEGLFSASPVENDRRLFIDIPVERASVWRWGGVVAIAF